MISSFLIVTLLFREINKKKKRKNRLQSLRAGQWYGPHFEFLNDCTRRGICQVVAQTWIVTWITRFESVEFLFAERIKRQTSCEQFTFFAKNLNTVFKEKLLVFQDFFCYEIRKV